MAPSSQHFNMARCGVADPAAQTERGCLLQHEPAKADALHAALYEITTDAQIGFSHSKGSVADAGDRAQERRRRKMINVARAIVKQ